MANPNPVMNHEAGKGFTTSNNVMRATFDAVKNAPKMLQKEYVEMLALNGYKSSSTTSVLYQLMRAGQIVRDEHGQLSVTQDEYVPIKAQQRKPRVLLLDKAPEPKPRQIVIVKKPREKSEGIAALTPDTVVKADGEYKLHAPAFKAFHPSSIVDGLTVLHARELYDYLKKIFGGQ